MRDYFDWAKDAACRGLDSSLFRDPKNKYEVARAKRVCQKACPVAKDCLLYSIIHLETGIWGGHTDAERYQLGENIRPRLVEIAVEAGVFHSEFLKGRADSSYLAA